jgi:hypothetical protein
MPCLRLLHLGGCTRLGLDELLADAAGCPELQELEVAYSSDPYNEMLQLQEEDPGLAALAGGACRGQLRRLVLAPPGSQGKGGIPLGHVAALLRSGCCPQVRQLELHVQFDLGALVELVKEQLGVAEGMAEGDEGDQQPAEGAAAADAQQTRSSRCSGKRMGHACVLKI